MEVILVVYVIHISFLKNNICYSICRFEITVVLVACIVWLNTKKGLKHHDLTFFKSVFNYSHMNVKEIVILFFMSNGCLIIYRQVFIHKTLEKLIAKQSEEVSVNNFCVCQTFPLLYVLGTLRMWLYLRFLISRIFMV